MRPRRPPPEYFLGCIALCVILALYGSHKRPEMADPIKAAWVVLAASLIGVVVALVSWYLGMHRKFPRK